MKHLNRGKTAWQGRDLGTENGQQPELQSRDRQGAGKTQQDVQTRPKQKLKKEIGKMQKELPQPVQMRVKQK